MVNRNCTDPTRRHILGMAAGFALMPTMLRAQTSYPSDTVRMIVPVSPGGSTDKLARFVSEGLGKAWNRAVIVENMTGAGGTIGANAVVTANSDGHTLLLHSDAVLLNTIVYKKPRYALADLVPVVRIAANAQIIVVNPSLGISTLKEYIDLANSRDGGLNVALPTNAGIAHIAHEMFVLRSKIPVNYIPYDGGAPAATDVMGGHVDATIITLAAVTEFIAAGRLVPIAVTTDYRQPALPEVPTIAESGFEGYSVESWQGILAPVGTPVDVVAKINADVNNILGDPQSRGKIEAMGFGIGGGSPEDFSASLEKEAKIYAEVIAKSGVETR